MKTMKKIVCAALAFAMLAVVAFGFAGCGESETGKYIVGGTGPLTGGAASYGISVNEGAVIAVEEINKNGGLNGVEFELVMKDDGHDPAKASQNYDTLYEDGMQFSIGGVTSAPCKAFAEKAVADNVFFMTPSASEQAVIEYGDNCFRVCFGDPDQGTLAAQKIKDDGFTNVGTLYDSSDSYSSGIYDAFKAEAAKLGLTYTETKFDAENKDDFSTQAETLKDCDLVFMPFYYTEASKFITASVAKGSNAVFFGCDGFDGIADMLKGQSFENEVKYITPFDAESTDATVVKFVNAYKAKYNKTPDQFAADGYDAVMSMFEAAKSAGVNDVKISASDLCNVLKAKMTASDFKYVGATGEMTWDATGACTKVPQIVKLNLNK